MIYYLGIKVTKVLESVRISKNTIKAWKYGYDKKTDVIVISKDGTLGEIYNINGINIGLPEIPKDKKKIINWDKTETNQKWKRVAPPAGINEKTQYDDKFHNYIEEEIRRRKEGVWIYLNGREVYLPGLSYFFYQWNRLDEGYPTFRVIQNELIIYWEACKADERCYGICNVKNRRFGWTSITNAEQIESGTTNEDKELGIISKTGKDAKKNFSKLVRTFKKLPAFFMPVWDGTTTPKTELIFTEPTRKKRKDDTDIVEFEEGLDTLIAWHNTVINAMDGDKVFRSAIDEAGKWPKDCPFSEYWNIVKTSHRQGIRISGKAMVGSTVNAMKKGGSEFKTVHDQSYPAKRNKNDQTVSGLYNLFIDTVLCWEGFFDVYGFSIYEDPKEPVLTDLGKYTSIGAITHWNNEAEALKDDPAGYNEFLRQNPRTLKHAFRDEATECDFNLVKLLDQEEYNDTEHHYNHTAGTSDMIERGNFTWKDGIQDTEVIWRPDPINGRFWIAKNCHPPLEYRNKKEMKAKNGILAWAPMAEHLGCFGVDPYNRSKNADGRGSLGAIHLETKYNTSNLPNDAFILEYIDRPAKVELFFEDVLMAMVYYSVPMLAELSNESFLKMIKNRGYRHFSMNNPFKEWKDLSYTEKELGGAPPQDTKIGDQQFFAMQTYIEDHIGYATVESIRPIGEMGFMPFNRTLNQWKEVDTTNRTKFDAYISSSLALLGNQRRVKVIKQDTTPIGNPFTKYDNTGLTSKVLIEEAV